MRPSSSDGAFALRARGAAYTPCHECRLIDPLVNLSSLVAMAAGPALRSAGLAADASDGVRVSANAASGVADNVISIEGEPTAVEAKYVGDWAASLRNPASEIGGKPWVVDERQQMMRQVRAYSKYFPGGIV